jgi:hypothetical protein
MQKIILVIIGAIFIIGVGKLIAIGMDRNEVHECLKWQQQSFEYEGTFYLTKWQAMQCQSWNVVIDAKII